MARTVQDVAPRARRAPRGGALAAALGVTRVARVTGLDRAGVEVACAVRPGGHVLQVTNGKGESWATAARGALLEAAELWCSERVEAGDLVWACAAELVANGARHVAPMELGGEAGAGQQLAWRAARDLSSGADVLVPAGSVHAPPHGGPLLGAAGLRWTSNGMGAHATWPSALLHALLEAVERDQVARALPDGFTERHVRARRLSPAILARAAPAAARLAACIASRGFEVHLLDARPEPALGLPVAAALLFDREGGPVPLTAGYACALEFDCALRGALLEAAQSRLTDIHGAREDVAPMAERDVARLRRACGRAAGGGVRPRSGGPDGERSVGGVGSRGRAPERAKGESDAGAGIDPGRGVTRVVRLLRRAGYHRILALDLAPASLGVRVAKVIVPGLLVSDLLQA
jgi:ribosomal protein S12 methylthiotransferase accessory factor